VFLPLLVIVREGFVVFKVEEIEGEKESNSLREREFRGMSSRR